VPAWSVRIGRRVGQHRKNHPDGRGGSARQQVGNRHRIALGQPTERRAPRAGNSFLIARRLHVCDDVSDRLGPSLLGTRELDRGSAGQRHRSRRGDGKVVVGGAGADARGSLVALERMLEVKWSTPAICQIAAICVKSKIRQIEKIAAMRRIAGAKNFSILKHFRPFAPLQSRVFWQIRTHQIIKMLLLTHLLAAWLFWKPQVRRSTSRFKRRVKLLRKRRRTSCQAAFDRQLTSTCKCVLSVAMDPAALGTWTPRSLRQLGAIASCVKNWRDLLWDYCGNKPPYGGLLQARPLCDGRNLADCQASMCRGRGRWRGEDVARHCGCSSGDLSDHGYWK